jgi:hypothetical protein
MQDRVYDEPMHREEEERPHQDVFGIDCGLWGSAPGRWTWTMMDRTPPVMIGRFPGHVAAFLGLFGTCGMMLEPQEGQRFAHLVFIMP